MIYQEWLTEWLSTCVKPIVKVRTFEKYDAIVRRQIAPRLGQRELSELSPSVLQRFTAELTEIYSPNTVTGVIAVVRNSLLRAQKTGMVEREFSSSIQRPRTREKKIECFSVAEQKIIEKYVIFAGKPKLYGVILCLYTGMRIGELLALQWSDVDLKRGYISVNKTCRDSYENGEYAKVTDTPKTAKSTRVIPVPKQLLPYLKKLKKCGISGYVICDKNGKTVPVRSYQRTFELMLKGLKIPHRGFHALRHTFATRAIECGMDVKTLSEILGHKDSSITLNRYAHSLAEHKAAMMNKVGKLLE